MLEVPKTTPYTTVIIRWFPRSAHRTQHLVVLVAVTHHSARRQSEIRKGKGKVQRKPCVSFQKSPPRRITQDQVNSLSMELWQHMKCLPQKLIRDLVPKVSVGGWSYSHALPSMKQNSGLPERKWVFNTNHIVFTIFTNHLGSVIHSYQEMMGTSWNSSLQTPAKGQPCKKAFL